MSYITRIDVYDFADGDFVADVVLIANNCETSVHETKPSKREQTARKRAEQWLASSAGRKAVEIELFLLSDD